MQKRIVRLGMVATLSGAALMAAPSTAGAANLQMMPDSTITAVVTTGALSMSAPVSNNLGSGAPGTTISGALGPVTVTDNRALLSASWTATASASDFTTGAATPAETIPASDATYSSGPVITTGTITATATTITLSGTATPVVTGTSGVGDNTASWNPTVSISVPGSAVGGAYTGTLTESVS